MAKPAPKGPKQKPRQQEAKPGRGKKRVRSFTDKQLGIEPLNTVAKPQPTARRGKKGKVFVEDQDRLLGILAEVNDRQDGQIRTKLQRVQDREAVRVAKLQEFEAKEKRKQDALDARKKAIAKGTKSTS